MKYWYNPKLDAYRHAASKPDPWIRLDGTICEWYEISKETFTNAYMAWARGERVL